MPKSKQLVYRPYHAITTDQEKCILHAVDSFGAIVHKFALPEWESIQFYELSEYRFAVFFATPGRLERWLYVCESATFTLLKHIPLETSVLSLTQLRQTKQIVILTRAQGFHIYSNSLEFEQQIKHDGVLVECLCELEDGTVVTATMDYELHFWDPKQWTKLSSIKIIPTFDDPDLDEFNKLHRVVYWREQSILIVITENSFTLYDPYQKQWRISRCLDPSKDNYPILLKDNFLFRYRYFHDVRLFTDVDILFMKQIPHYTHGTSLRDGRVFLQTKNKMIEYSVDDQEFTKIRIRHHLNDFQFVFALQTKQDNDLLIKRLDPFVQRAIPILDLRLIVYEFI